MVECLVFWDLSLGTYSKDRGHIRKSRKNRTPTPDSSRNFDLQKFSLGHWHVKFSFNRLSTETGRRYFEGAEGENVPVP